MRIAPAIELSPEQRAALEQWARGRSLPARVVERARIVLRAAAGQQDKAIAQDLGMTPKKVSRWRRRDLTGPGWARKRCANGEVFGLCQERHRHQEWLKFLRLIDQTIPPDLELHVICDNSSTHKHDRVQRWVERHPRFHMHFTPTSSSWLNTVDRFFRDLTQNRLRRGVFRDVKELITAIGDLHRSPQPEPQADHLDRPRR